jgi:hypothetical protein
MSKRFASIWIRVIELFAGLVVLAIVLALFSVVVVFNINDKTPVLGKACLDLAILVIGITWWSINQLENR